MSDEYLKIYVPLPLNIGIFKCLSISENKNAVGKERVEQKRKNRMPLEPIIHSAPSVLYVNYFFRDG